MLGIAGLSGEATTAGWRGLVEALCFGDDGVDGGFENLMDAGHLLTTALHVESTHLLGDRLALVCRDWSQSLGLEEVNAGALVAQVRFEAEEDDGRGWAEMEHFGVPLNLCQSMRPSIESGQTNLVHDVLERVGAIDCEADKEQVGFGIREGAQSVILFLAGGIPEREFDDLARRLVLAVGDVVFEDGGHIFLEIMSVAIMQAWLQMAIPLGRCLGCS